MPENYVEGSTVNCVLTFQGEYIRQCLSVFQPTQLFKYLSVHLGSEHCITVLEFKKDKLEDNFQHFTVGSLVLF